APLPGARPLPVLWGLLPRAGFTQPQENILVQAIKLLSESGRVFTYGDSIVMVMRRIDGAGDRLAPLRTGSVAEVGGEDLLASLITCQHGESQFPLPRWFAEVLLRAEPLLARLPRIQHYATRPIFDSDFVLRGPGLHPDVGYLVHGPEVEPVLPAPSTT